MFIHVKLRNTNGWTILRFFGVFLNQTGGVVQIYIPQVPAETIPPEPESKTSVVPSSTPPGSPEGKTRGILQRRPVCQRSSEAQSLAVLDVTAQIHPTGGKHVTNSRFLRAKTRNVMAQSCNYVLAVTASILMKLFVFMKTVLLATVGNIAGYFFIWFLRWIDVFGRFLVNWWLRLPDRREIEHRQIAASQFVESLDQLLPGHIPSPSTGQGGTKREATDDVERFLDEYFKQSCPSRNPISGLMNIRLMTNVPEVPSIADISGLTAKAKSTKGGADDCQTSRWGELFMPAKKGGRRDSKEPGLENEMRQPLWLSRRKEQHFDLLKVADHPCAEEGCELASSPQFNFSTRSEIGDSLGKIDQSSGKLLGAKLGYLWPIRR